MSGNDLHILTFDLEEWFHLLDNASTRTDTDWAKYDGRILRNHSLILELLDHHNQKATFFCLGWVAKKYPGVIRNIAQQGHEIATHSHMHQLVYEQTPDHFRNDIEYSIKVLEDCVGEKVRAFRAPGFSIGRADQWALEILIDLGIEIDCSVFPAKRAHGGFSAYGSSEPAIIDIQGRRIKEFPINTYPFIHQEIVFSGGGYFRLFPYRAIKHMMNKSPYVMTYFHPRDFDDAQPVIPELSIVRRFKSYYGLKAAHGKLDKLLADFHMVDLRTADAHVMWDKVRIISL